MIHQYKVGDKVRIKEREGKAVDYPYFFLDEMRQQKGKTFTIEKIAKEVDPQERRKFYNGDDHWYLFKEDLNRFRWHSSMFEPVLENPELTTSISLKKGDLISICDIVGEIRDSGYDEPAHYLDFDNINEQEHYACCAKLRELVPNFDKIADKFDPVWNDTILFPEFSTIDKLMQFVQAINAEYNFKQSTILKKSETYEIRFQKPKTSSIRGSVPAGRAICDRRRKTAIELGHLSNTTCYC